VGRVTQGLAFVRDRGLDRGIAGQGHWLAVGLVAGGLRFIIRKARRRDELVYRHVLEPGQKLVITHLTESFADLGVKRSKP
jgi:hypothetical protein